MKNIYFTLIILLSMGSLKTEAQRLEQFSENRNEFITELQDYMTASKRKVMEDTYKEFESVFMGGTFTEEEAQQILKTGNLMLGQRMTASPYFSDYLTALTLVKKVENGTQRFKEWHQVLEGMLVDIENRKLKPFQDYVKFSIAFFEQNALRSSTSGGTSWYALADNYQLKYEDKTPIIAFDKLDLKASRRNDSILILETKGEFLPVAQIWKGQGGKVTWERHELDEGIFVELGDYSFDAKKSLYEVESSKLYYPLFFGNQAIEGSFSDKLVALNDATGGSYPRFESSEQFLEINNIGDGVKFNGGFRLHGATIYGFGTKEDKANLQIFNNSNDLVFNGNAELFTIKKEERIVGERVESSLYFGQDSIYHPSVNIRFEIPSKQIQLNRGQRGSDRNPFANSMHKVNIGAENITAYVDQDSVIIGKKTIAIAKKQDVTFESIEYFQKSEYQRIQNIATSNPIAIMKVTAEREGSNFIDANLLAQRINSRFTVENIQSLLYDLVAKGFINYDSDKQEVEVKSKVFHYTNADEERVDYDVMNIRSSTDSTNAILNLRNSSIIIDGVSNFEFSRKQQVGVKPYGDQIVLKKNRNVDFDGKLFAGYSSFIGQNFKFDYDKFQIDMDSVRYFDLFIPDTFQLENPQQKKAYSIDSRIENVSGVLLIDAPNNKSGREEIPMFPSLQTKDYSYVYYYSREAQDSAYLRDSFFFKLDPFSFNQLDQFSKEDIHFDGKMHSADIFPIFEETLKIQADSSLGFITKTPGEGYPAYRGKGNYKNEILLNSKGMQGKGELKYLGASVNSEDFIFKPKQMEASAERFDLEEDRAGEVEVPQVRGADVNIDWRPYKDSMYVRSAEAPFDLYKEDNHKLEGMLILTPGGLKGNGTLDWSRATMKSELFSFGAFSAQADTTEISIKALDADEIALNTKNVNGTVDFDEKTGFFKANDEFLTTTLPYNQYSTSMNEFTWDMEEETIEFKSDEDNLGTFISIHPDQDSLIFQGRTSTYDLKTNELNIGGVPFIVSSDAFIYPDSGLVQILPEGEMKVLENAKIVADTLNKHHVINRATVEVRGRRVYNASGFYEYNIGDKEQEFELQNIEGRPVGRGSWTEKRSVTRATGEVTPEDKFYIDHKTEFQGTISLNADSKNLQFDGFSRLDADKLPQKYWFTVSSEGDKNNLAIKYEVPKSYDGEPLRTGLYLSKETARIYPRVMMPLYFRKDRPILPAQGFFKYDKDKDEFIFGDSTKVIADQLRGNRFIFKNRDGSVEAEGKFNIGSQLKYVSVEAAGSAKTVFPPPPPEVNEDIMEINEDMMTIEDDSTALDIPELEPIPEQPMTAELMAGVRLIVPDKLIKIIQTDFKSSSFDARPIAYLTDLNFYKKAVSEFLPNTSEEELASVFATLSTGGLEYPKKDNDFTFLFSKLDMKWDADYQSFVTTDKNSGLVSIAGETVNKKIECYIEFKMPSTENDDRLYIYIKSPSQLFYFFGFKQGIMSITSNNPSFMDEVLALKAKEKILKMKDGETYEIQDVAPGEATRFVRRVQAASRD